MSEKTRKRIDFHVHLSLYTYHKPWVTEWMSRQHPEGYEAFIRRYSDPGAFEELLSAEGIDYACILAELSYVTTGVCTNKQVREFCAGRKRLIPFCDLNPHLYTDLGAELHRKVETEAFEASSSIPPISITISTTPECIPSTGRPRIWAFRCSSIPAHRCSRARA